MMHIGRLAQQAGTTTRAVRYYEEMGLIKPEGRSPGGFRYYSDQQLDRLRMILSLKGMEFDLDQIKTILEKQSNNETGGKLASALLSDLKTRLDEVDRQLVHYQQLKDKLRQNIQSLCNCLPCDLRLEDRLCVNCEVLRKNAEAPLPFFHVN